MVVLHGCVSGRMVYGGSMGVSWGAHMATKIICGCGCWDFWKSETAGEGLGGRWPSLAPNRSWRCQPQNRIPGVFGGFADISQKGWNWTICLEAVVEQVCVCSCRVSSVPEAGPSVISWGFLLFVYFSVKNKGCLYS